MAKPKTARKSAKKAAKTVARKASKPAAKKAARPATLAPEIRTVTPYLSQGNAAEAIEWYKKAFGAKEIDRQTVPPGKVMHCALKLGDSQFFLSDIFPGSDSRDPRDMGPSVNLHIWHKDADKLWANAVANGAKVTMPMDDMFWGDRYGRLIDPFGHSWALSCKSKLSKAQLEQKRVEAMKGFPA
jgi:uncharacterized glyoxalase superfamily protein PhnB